MVSFNFQPLRLLVFIGICLISLASLAEKPLSLEEGVLENDAAISNEDPFQSSTETAFLKVDQAYQVSPKIDGSDLSFDWAIHPGYYLYQHQFKLEVRQPEKSEFVSLNFQKGKKKFDEIFQKELEVYYGSTQVNGVTTLTPPYELKVSSQGCADAGLCYPPRNQYFSVDASGNIEETASATMKSSASSGSGNDSNIGGTTTAPEDVPFLPFVLLGAMLGGLILNLMPCVFPVLSLKALSLASSHLSHHKQHLHGWAYTAGVVGSFVLAASIILVARGAGESLGWGFQLQQPGFVAFMAYLFFVMGLSLSGVFYLGTSLMGAGQSLTTGEGLKSSFFTGVLAALVASPCTAPFMATALGFALTQPAYISLSIFAALGFGMAFPFILLSYSPVLARNLPAPGPWMETLKQVLAFPLYLTSVWLLWVLANQTSGSGAMAVLSGAVLITFGIWLLQQQTKSSAGKIFTKGLAIASLLFAASIGWKVGDFKIRDNGLWEPYSPNKLEQLRAEGTPVFVDLTADWCITCKFNERVALNTEAVTKFALLNDIVMLQGDWTNADPDISELLERFGRSGVPLYLMYPSSANTPPEVLPQVLTEALVLESMEKALQ
ncbi:MAG: protein-disulfide reductase DsbD [Agarilytica sp.]